MHPILSQIRRLALYLLVWIPLAALVAYLMRALGGIDVAGSGGDVASALPFLRVRLFVGVVSVPRHSI